VVTGVRWRNDYELLACVASRLHVQRIVGYPDLVETNRMTPAAAADGIRIMGTIACSWWAIAERQPEQPWIHDPELGGAWPYERIAALTIAAKRPRAAAADLPNDFEIVGFADAIDTLIWWETARPSARLTVGPCDAFPPAEPAAPVVPAKPATPAAPPALRAGRPFLFGEAA